MKAGKLDVCHVSFQDGLHESTLAIELESWKEGRLSRQQESKIARRKESKKSGMKSIFTVKNFLSTA